MTRTTYAHDPEVTLAVTSCANTRIILPFDEATYPDVLQNRRTYKAFLTAQIQAHPELFPPTIQDGWSLYGFTEVSTKRALRLRRIQTTADGQGC